MKVSLQNKMIADKLNFKGYETEKSELGSFQYTFNFPYDSAKYNAYVELCSVKLDENNNYQIVRGLKNKDRDSYELPLKSGKTTVNLAESYGISEKSAFGYHFKLVPKTGKVPIYLVDSGDVMNHTHYGQAHDIYNIVTPGSNGSDIGSAILLIPDSYNAMYAYDKDGKIIPNVKYLNTINATRNFANKMGGTLAGIEHDLDAGKFDNYTKIFSTPLFTADSLSHHAYWNNNCMQIANSLGNIKNYQNLQKKLFAKGINWVSDGAFVNEGLEGVHFRHILKWGENSPYFHWFNASQLKNKQLLLGVFPKDTSIIGFKVVNAPYILETSDNNIVTDRKANRNYDKNKPTFVQVFDKRLVTPKEAEDNSPLIKDYSKPDTDNVFNIVTHNDTVIPYSFEVNPDDLTHNMDNLIEYNSRVKDGSKLTKDSYEAIRILSKFKNFVLGEKIEGGFGTWDANVDIPKLTYVYSKENLKNLYNIDNDLDRLAYDETISHNNIMTQDYALTAAQYWTKMTNRILNLFVAQNLKNVDEHNAEKAFAQIKENITDKHVFPKKLDEAINKNVVENILNGDYDLKELSKEEYKNVLISGMMDLPLDSIEFGDNIISVLASPMITKRAIHPEEIGKSRFEMLQKYDDTHLPEEYKPVYSMMNSLYEKEMLDFAEEILGMLNKKLPANLQLNKGLNVSLYGKYVLPFLTQEIAKFAVVKGLFPDAYAAIDNENGGVIYDYSALKQTSLQELGINANSPEDEAKQLINRLKGSPFSKRGIPAISEQDKKLLADALYKMIEGTNPTSFKLAEAIVDRSKAGLDWRIDATKDIADIESLRKDETDFEDTWSDIIDFWSKFADTVYKENPNSYLVAEVTDEMMMYSKAGESSPKYKMPKDVIMKFLRETGITSIANYSYFFTDIPALFGKRAETGDNWDLNYDKIYDLLGSGMHNEDKRNDFLHSGPFASLISSYTFVDNHDKPRILHALALDMELFYSNLNVIPDSSNEKLCEYRKTAYKVLHGIFGSEKIEKYVVDSYDFSRVSPKAIAMGQAMGIAFGKALNNMHTGPFKVLDQKQQKDAYKALAASIADLANGKYRGENFQADSFGVRPFDVVINMVVNQAVYSHNLKFSDDPEKNDELIKKLKKEMFYAALSPAITKSLAIMKYLVALPGNPTVFAGDDIGSTGYEQKTKNIYLQNRSVVHHEWLEDDSPYRQYDFLKEYKSKFDSIMALRKRPELHALNDGAPFLLSQSICREAPNMKVNALLRQSTDGSMVISLFNLSGANHDFNYPNEPEKYPVHIGAIELDPSNDGADAGLIGGLTPGIEFVDANNPNERYVVKKEHNHLNDHYYIAKKDGGDITLDDNIKILYYVSPELQENINRINSLKKALKTEDVQTGEKSNQGTFAQILEMDKKNVSFSGKNLLFNPQYNFIARNAYTKSEKSPAGQKLSVLSK